MWLSVRVTKDSKIAISWLAQAAYRKEKIICTENQSPNDWKRVDLYPD